MIPIVLFAYARPDHLLRTLECLKHNRVPLIYAFSDGPKTQEKQESVEAVRMILKEINWCQVVICERTENLGLGKSILAGVSEVLSKHDAAIVVEDDLIFVPGTYDYLCAALRHYQDDNRVMSVTGWTHPLVTPTDINGQPYFDGRAECLVWGTWSRAWQGMETDAWSLVQKCQARRINPYAYGIDLIEMAKAELKQNIWAVRWLYWHMLNRGLCVRPPHSLVEHIGNDAFATNCFDNGKWANPPLKPCPMLPAVWPSPSEHRACRKLWIKACGGHPTWIDKVRSRGRRLAGFARKSLKAGLSSIYKAAANDN